VEGAAGCWQLAADSWHTSCYIWGDGSTLFKYRQTVLVATSVRPGQASLLTLFPFSSLIRMTLSSCFLWNFGMMQLSGRDKFSVL
jgi:hypothetical protein